MVKVKREPEETDSLFRNVIESCCICNVPTRYWYLPYNQPLCQECAAKSKKEDVPKNPFFKERKVVRNKKK